ncbi:NAD(P)/FAD-dependent oxidoreductase [Edaphobacter albus]|uniref:NAD(P)/FAD-dependent oxidoreductase n=1 Tax=Edaphobacter sp. 4G125 TaxID=2763071 RepID=UPI001644EC01|nr:FAD-dependent oxidoreductase [Edaphobacter sp. 4G125]QNI37632.1 FAD-dependent oxidoreductase [Edaphobacter sp. 4G125]
MDHSDICIAGAGIIGLSLALELHHRGAKVTVLDQGEPLAEASTAAAGMLAANDPDNPPELLPLSELSRSLYPDYLARLFRLSGIIVPFQTNTTLQEIPAHASNRSHHLPLATREDLSLLLPQLAPGSRQFARLDENSLDPRELAQALLAAVRSTTIELISQTPVRFVRSNAGNVEVHTADRVLSPASVVDCTGAWGLTQFPPGHVRAIPRKGQMLAVTLPSSLPLNLVVRTPDIYIVPRTTGPMSGRAIIGATVEDAGFDKKVYPGEIARLRARATELLPDLAQAQEAETWAGLRPGSSDGLPLLGEVVKNHFVAAGHYRNGILLAPATAFVMAQLLLGESPQVDLASFSPRRKP